MVLARLGVIPVASVTMTKRLPRSEDRTDDLLPVRCMFAGMPLALRDTLLICRASAPMNDRIGEEEEGEPSVVPPLPGTARPGFVTVDDAMLVTEPVTLALPADVC